ncbi:MAG: hypothetical protein EBS51_01050 [Planctomycetia bacterium]|nr:hypothetical protein [Planctomycetia bacterium]
MNLKTAASWMARARDGRNRHARLIGLAVMLAAASCGTSASAQQAKGTVSFSREIAPLLVTKCGGCHVAGRKGNFQMASYDMLMRSGMVQRGAANASRLLEVILSGDMPRGGAKVSPAEVGLLQRWIDGGAGCDVPDPTVAIDLLARGAVAAAMPAAAPRPALKPGDVSFASDIASILVDQCGNCHSDTDPEGNLRLTSFQRLMRGGRNGPAVTASNGKGSLIVQKLRGTAEEGDRMPLGRDPLPSDVIAAIEKWIDQGATLDMLGPDDPLEAVAAAGRSRALGDAELLKTRAKAAGPVWRQALPDESPTVAARRRVTVLGNLPAERLVDIADRSERLEDKLRGLVIEGDGPLLKGGVVVYLFGKAYDFSAFWQEIVGKERPRGITGHAGVAGDVVYAAVLASSSDDDADLDLQLAEQIAAAAFTARSVPDWFARGAARSLAVRLAPKAALAKDWKRDAGTAVATIGSTADFLGGHADPAAVAVAAGNFATSFAPPARLAKLVAALDAGTPFPDAFTSVFKSTPEQLYTAWAAKQKPSKR